MNTVVILWLQQDRNFCVQWMYKIIPLSQHSWQACTKIFDWGCNKVNQIYFLTAPWVHPLEMTIFGEYESLLSTPVKGICGMYTSVFHYAATDTSLPHVCKNEDTEKLLKPKSMHHEVMTNGPFTDSLKFSSNLTMNRQDCLCLSRSMKPPSTPWRNTDAPLCRLKMEFSIWLQ